MTNESILVTAVYYSTPQSVMGGRGWDFSYYKPTLYAMSKLAAKKIVIYHDDAQEQNLKNFVKEYNLDTFELINLNLDQLPYYDKIFALKKDYLDTNNFSLQELHTRNNRLHLVCLLKVWFLQQTIKLNNLTDTPVTWIDAGLFHHALFPESVGGVELARFNLDNYHPISKTSKLTPSFGNCLVERLNSGKLIALGSQTMRLPVEWSHNIADTNLIVNLVGGLFGGQPTVINKLYDKFYEFLDVLIENKILSLEETILSKIFKENQELFNVSTFDTWYHDIPTDPCFMERNDETFMQPFYKTFFEFIETGNIREIKDILITPMSTPVSLMPSKYENYDLPNIAIYGSHNASFAVEYNGTILEVLEAERFLNIKNIGYTQYYVAAARKELASLVINYFNKKYGFTEYGYVLHQHCETIEENDQVVQYWRKFPAKHYIECMHHESHAAGCFYQSPFQTSLVVSFDGGGNDGYFKIYLANRGAPLKLLKEYRIDLGFPYMIFGEYLGDIKKESALNIGNLVYSGKILGLQSYGNSRPEWVQHFKEIYLVGMTGNTYMEHLESLGQKIGVSFDLKNRITGQLAYDVAATSQEAFEQIFFELVDETIKEHNTLPICVAGGCALNIVLNTKIRNRYQRPVFVGPNPNDCGLAVGMLANLVKPTTSLDVTYAGPDILDSYRLAEFVEKYSAISYSATELAKELVKGNIVGLVQGRSEHGPRALGNRSILCSPLIENIKDKLNEKVKHREWYRPFAPVVRLEDLTEYFEWEDESRWMSFCPKVRKKYIDVMPAIVHVDNTARVQTVTHEQNPFLYELLTEFKQLTGIGVLVNTSFNVDGKPILSTYKDAFWVFEKTELDALYIDGIFFNRKLGYEN